MVHVDSSVREAPDYLGSVLSIKEEARRLKQVVMHEYQTSRRAR